MGGGGGCLIVANYCVHILIPSTHPPSSSVLQGLKTGMYYLRSRPAANAIQFTVDQRVVIEAKKKQGGSGPGAEDAEKTAKDYTDMACSLQNREGCISCSA